MSANPYPVQLTLQVHLDEDENDTVVVNMGFNEGKLDLWIETPDGEASISLTKAQWTAIKVHGDTLMGAT